MSGGQAARVALAAIELSRFDVTLLDEPTNDLDFDGLERLEAFVGDRAGGVVRRLARPGLPRAHRHHGARARRARPHGPRCSAVAGPAYLDERATARRHAEEAYAVYQGQRRAPAQDRAQRQRQWATRGSAKETAIPRDNDKAQRDFRINRTEKLASKARQTERALERLERGREAVGGLGPALHHRAGRPGRAPSWPGSTAPSSSGAASGSVPSTSRSAGRTGSGSSARTGPARSTLVEALLGRLPLAAGERWIGPSVVVGELDQDRRRTRAATGDLVRDVSSTAAG